MFKFTLSIEGMMCAHCEARMTKTALDAFPSAQVTSNHTKKQTVIISEQDISQTEIEDLVKKAGYTLLSVEKEEVKKKSLFSVFKR